MCSPPAQRGLPVVQRKAEPLREVPAAVLDIIDNAVAAGVPAARRIILEAFQELIEGIGAAQIAEAIDIGAAGPIYATTEPWEAFEAKLFELFDAEGPIAAAGAVATAETVQVLPVDPAGIDFDAVSDAAVAWLDRRGARLVTAVSDNTRSAINLLVQDAYSGPASVEQAARRILKAKGFGINRPQARSFERFVADLLDPSGAGSGLTAKKIQQLIDKEHRRLLKVRANTIAATETANAGNAAQGRLWAQSVLDGVLDPQIYVMEWVTRVVDVCPRCQALDGTTAELDNGIFRSRPVVGGGKWNGRIIEVSSPTVHPYCYCTRRVIRRVDALDAADLAA